LKDLSDYEVISVSGINNFKQFSIHQKLKKK